MVSELIRGCEFQHGHRGAGFDGASPIHLCPQTLVDLLVHIGREGATLGRIIVVGYGERVLDAGRECSSDSVFTPTEFSLGPIVEGSGDG